MHRFVYLVMTSEDKYIPRIYVIYLPRNYDHSFGRTGTQVLHICCTVLYHVCSQHCPKQYTTQLESNVLHQCENNPWDSNRGYQDSEVAARPTVLFNLCLIPSIFAHLLILHSIKRMMQLNIFDADAQLEQKLIWTNQKTELQFLANQFFLNPPLATIP